MLHFTVSKVQSKSIRFEMLINENVRNSSMCASVDLQSHTAQIEMKFSISLKNTKILRSRELKILYVP